MLLKKYLNLTIILFKTQKIAALIPIFIYYLVIPILNYAVYLKSGIEFELYSNIVTYMQILIPIFSVWPGSINIREHIEGDGRELLYLANRNSDIFIFAISSVINLICLVPLFSVYCSLFENMVFECARLILFILFFCCTTLSVLIITNNLSLSLSAMLIYVLVSIFADSKSWLLYYNPDVIEPPMILIECIPLAGIGIIALITAVAVRSRKNLG